MLKKLFYNGTILTVNDAQPQAEALLVEDGLIKAVGSLDAVRAYQDADTELIDLDGKTLLPGFIDGHGHIGSMTAGLPKVYPPPNGKINSKEALLETLKQLISHKENILENGWFVAHGYDNAFFENNAHPTREDLDHISTEIPMFILHVSGHVAVVNSKALELIGWTEDTPNPEGGVLQRDPVTGELNGLIEEKAVIILGYGMAMFGLSIPALADIFRNLQDFYASNGITTAQDGGALEENLKMLAYCQENDVMIIDVITYPMEEFHADLIPDDSPQQKYDRHVKIGGAKIAGDGSPQAKTAWLTEPYYIQPENADADYQGYPVYTDEQMYDFCKIALEHNWQLFAHCNGDAAGDQFITAYRQAKLDTGNTRNLRPVMIHAQTVREDQLDAMKELGMIPSFFHDHVFYWGDYHYESVLGPERGSRISPLASAVKRGMKFTLHNDMAVTPINPIFNIHNAVNRVTRNGRLLGPEYRIDVMEAIRAVTIYGAYQHFDENIKGSLEVGKLADLVILDKNPLEVPKETIKDIKVLETIKEGVTIYRA